MQVIIPRVPKATTKGDVQDLVETILSKRRQFPFTKAPEVERCRVMSIEAANGEKDLHGIVSIQPEKAARWLIHHFKSQSLYKKTVHAREYVVRQADNGVYDSSTDRRRKDLHVSTVSEPVMSVQGLTQFAREHH